MSMRLFVFDVDGTIIDYDQNIKSETIESINNLLRCGESVAIASGRPFPGVKKYLSLFVEGNKYAICSNGASIYDFDGNLLFKDGLPISLLNEMYLDFEKSPLNLNVFAFFDNYVAYYKYDEWIERELRLNDALPYDLNKINYNKDMLIDKIIVGGDPENSKQTVIKKEICDKYHVVRSSIFFIDIMNKGIDKASGVSKLAEIINVNQKDIYTFGDALNDYLMIKNFNGIAMGNALKEVKEVAKFVTKDVNDCGITYAIDNYINKII